MTEKNENLEYLNKSFTRVVKFIKFSFIVSVALISSIFVLLQGITNMDIVDFLITLTDKSIPVVTTIFGFVLASFTFTINIIGDDYIENEHREFLKKIRKRKFDTIQKNIFGFYWTIFLLLGYLLYLFSLNILLIESPQSLMQSTHFVQQLILYITILWLAVDLYLIVQTTRNIVIYAQVRYILKHKKRLETLNTKRTR